MRRKPASPQANIDEMLKSTNPEIRRLLGAEGEFGKGIGLDNDWVVRVVKAVGNYGEIYERNVGPSTPLKIARGLNNLWNKGGTAVRPADRDRAQREKRRPRTAAGALAIWTRVRANRGG